MKLYITQLYLIKIYIVLLLCCQAELCITFNLLNYSLKYVIHLHKDCQSQKICVSFF